jgi:uncharacterized membrane protein YgcG
MTGMSTILAIIPLIIFGGDTIREFVVPLLIGIVAGACSSIFIASPIYYELTKIGSGGEGVAGSRRSRSRYEESVAKARAGKKAKRQAAEDALPAPDAEPKPSKSDENKKSSGNKGGKGGGDKPTGGGGGGKGQGKKSRKKRKSSRTGGAVV